MSVDQILGEIPLTLDTSGRIAKLSLSWVGAGVVLFVLMYGQLTALYVWKHKSR